MKISSLKTKEDGEKESARLDLILDFKDLKGTISYYETIHMQNVRNQNGEKNIRYF
jgi:hypothetical protein